jgi:hypothetical protein
MNDVIIPIALQGVAVIMFIMSKNQPEGSVRRRMFRFGTIIFVLLSLIAFIVEMSFPTPA